MSVAIGIDTGKVVIENCRHYCGPRKRACRGKEAIKISRGQCNRYLRTSGRDKLSLTRCISALYAAPTVNRTSEIVRQVHERALVSGTKTKKCDEEKKRHRNIQSASSEYACSDGEQLRSVYPVSHHAILPCTGHRHHSKSLILRGP